MNAEPIDFAVVKAEHRRHVARTGYVYCNACEAPDPIGCLEWPCLPYRLADEAERLAGKVARVEVECAVYDATGMRSVARNFRRALANQSGQN